MSDRLSRHSSTIDPDRLSGAAIEAAFPGLPPSESDASCRRRVASFLDALLADDVAIDRALRTFHDYPEGTATWPDVMRAALAAAVQEESDAE